MLYQALHNAKKKKEKKEKKFVGMFIKGFKCISCLNREGQSYQCIHVSLDRLIKDSLTFCN